MKRRISQLEAGLHDFNHSPSTPSVPSVPSAASPVTNRSQQNASQSSVSADPVENALGQIGVLSLNAMGHSANSARGIADRVACSSLVLEAIGLQRGSPSAPTSTDYRGPRLSSSALLFRTPIDLNYDVIGTSEVIQRFSESANVYLSGMPGFSCFDTFDTWQEARSNGSLSSLLETEPEKILLVKLMLATGICMNSKGESVDLLVSALTQDIAQIITRLQDHALLQILILQIMLSMYHPLGGSAWLLLGLAMTKAISLGLHRESLQSLGANNEERQGLFWAIYVLDRTIALAEDRPFAIADPDTTLEIDTNIAATESAGHESTLQLLRNCMTHHAQLMSDMRHNSTRDGYFHLMNYYHWRDTYQRSIFAKSDKSLQSLRNSIICKHGLQLQCRALVQLSTMMIHGSLYGLTQLRHEAIETIPRYITYLAQVVERHAVALTFVDGNEVFAAVLIFIHLCLSTSHEAPRQSVSTRLSRNDTKVVIMSMDLLLSVSKRFAAMKPLRDVVWAFMTAHETMTSVESNRTSGEADPTASSIATLGEAVEKADVPRNLAAFMQDCLQ